MQVLVVDEHELAAGKLAALVAQSASRDVFDARELLRRPRLDRARLRLGFVVYGGANRSPNHSDADGRARRYRDNLGRIRLPSRLGAASVFDRVDAL